MMRTHILPALGAAAFLLTIAAASRYAQSVDLIEADTSRRVMQVLFGLMLAAYANRMPKNIGQWSSSPRAAKWSQSALRVGGWSLTLGGLAHAALWAVAPVPVASLAAKIAVASATAVTVGYAAWSFANCRQASQSPAMWRP